MRVLHRILIYLAFYTFGSYGGHPHDGNEKSADNPPVNIFDYIPPSLQQNSTYVRRLHHGSGHGNRPPRPVPPPVRPRANPPDGEQTRMFIKLSSVGDVRPAEASIKNVVLQINNGPNLLSDQESSMEGVPFNRGKSPDWEIFTGKTSFMSSWGTLRPWGRTSQVADLYGDGEGLSKEILVPISANEIEHVKLSVDLRFGRAYDNPNRKYVMETGYIVNDSYVSLASVSAAPTINDPGPRWWQTYQASSNGPSNHCPQKFKTHFKILIQIDSNAEENEYTVFKLVPNPNGPYPNPNFWKLVKRVRDIENVHRTDMCVHMNHCFQFKIADDGNDGIDGYYQLFFDGEEVTHPIFDNGDKSAVTFGSCDELSINYYTHITPSS